MPYKRTRTRRRRKAKTSYSMAKKALYISKKLSRGVEKKHYDFDFNGFILATTNSLAPIPLNSAISQGTGDSQRVGDKIQMLGMRFKISLFWNDSDQDASLIRLIVIYDKEDSISTLQDILSHVNTNNVVNSAYYVDNRHRFNLLYDKVFAMNIGNQRIRQVDLSRKLNKPTNFTGGTNTIDRGSLKLFAVSTANPAELNPPQLQNGYCRVWYQDS